VAYVVDVTGHGVPAALLSVTAMHALSPVGETAALLRRPSDRDGIGPLQRPSLVITELNQRFSSSDNDGRFLTMILSVLDTESGRMVFSRAGHPLPIVLRGEQVVPVDAAGGPPIGLLGAAAYADVEVQMEPGDRLCLYSDGFPEQSRPSDGEEWGERRFEAMLAGHARIAGNELVTKAVDSLAEWAGERRFTDDVSLVVVEWLGR
jgi:sigma-B regulation protein RsbU (phosphoserine phosphatase)